MPSQIVDNAESLAELCQDLQGLERIGLDTEFHSERRYSPELMLVQLATDDGRSWLVDPLAVSLKPLGAVLGSLTWVCHGSRMDIRLMYEATDARPKMLLDTQLLAAMCHIRYPVGLASLTDKLLGKNVSKGATLSDWSQRPLTDTQQRYAALDAQLVLELIDKLSIRRPEPKYLRWALQAGEELIIEALQPADPDRSWKTLNLAPRLDDPTRRVLHHMHHWRDRVARQKGHPPHFIVADGMLLSIGRNRPRTLDELRENRRLPSGLVQRHGAKILELIAQGLADTRPPPRVPSLPQSRSARLLMAWAEAQEQELGIAASLLMPWPLALDVVHRRAQAWTGWRAEVAGQALDDFMAGRISLQMGRKGPRLV